MRNGVAKGSSGLTEADGDMAIFGTRNKPPMLRQKVFELTSFGFWRWYLFDSLVPLVGAFLTLDALVWLYYAAFEFFSPF